MKKNVVVLLNTRSKGGMASTFFNNIHSKLNEKYNIIEIIEIDLKLEWKFKIRKSILNGQRLFMAIGGDGTVHSLINGIIENKGDLALAEFILGGVGLGSSNDFHKPFSKKIANFPIRDNFESTIEWDVMQVDLSSRECGDFKKYCLISGSIGLVADANAYFNEGGALLRFLKKFWTGGAIILTAIREILLHRPMKILDNNENAICFLKTNYLSGSMRINKDVSKNNNKVNLLQMKNMNRIELAKTMSELEKNIFKESEKLKFDTVDDLNINLTKEINVELDGEIYQSRKLQISIYPQRVRVAGNE